MGANVALEMAGSGAFTGPVVLLAAAFSRSDEAIFLRVLDRLGRVLDGYGSVAPRLRDSGRASLGGPRLPIEALASAGGPVAEA
jgi:hypothetical protein